MSVPAVESWKSAEVGGVAVRWTERRPALEEAPALVRQEPNSRGRVRVLGCPVHAGRRLDQWDRSTREVEKKRRKQTSVTGFKFHLPF